MLLNNVCLLSYLYTILINALYLYPHYIQSPINVLVYRRYKDEFMTDCPWAKHKCHIADEFIFPSITYDSDTSGIRFYVKGRLCPAWTLPRWPHLCYSCSMFRLKYNYVVFRNSLMSCNSHRRFNVYNEHNTCE